MRRGIIVAGGTGTRLQPITSAVSKQLMPVYDKPMIYYPLAVFMLAGIRDILLIVNPGEQFLFERMLGDGGHLGLRLRFATQDQPAGIAEAFLIGADFVDGRPSALILGDNLFIGSGLVDLLRRAEANRRGALIFGYQVANPSAYGVVELGPDGRVCSLEEKPAAPKSCYAVPGLYFYDEHAVDHARSLRPSARGELEITDLNLRYLQADALEVEMIGNGITWIDGGTPDTLLDAALLIKVIEDRQGLKVCCPEEIAWRMGYISDDQLARLAAPLCASGYGTYLLRTLEAGRARGTSGVAMLRDGRC